MFHFIYTVHPKIIYILKKKKNNTGDQAVNIYSFSHSHTILYETLLVFICIHRINTHMEYNTEKCRTKEITNNKRSTHFLKFKNIAHSKVAQKLLAAFTKRMRY